MIRRTEVVVVVEREEQEMGDGAGMQRAAREVEQFYRRRLPESEELDPAPFAAPIVRGLWIGMLAGALIGLLFGQLLLDRILVVPGWEGLYSMGPFTFGTFWTLMGLAAGLAIGGLIGLFSVPAAPEVREEG